MRKARRHSEDETEVDMTPMLDIVFIMLIFFIVTTSFVKEDAIELLRPSSSKTNDDDKRVKKGPIVLSIDENDQITIGRRLIDISAVGSNIENARINNPTGIVIVRAAESASAGVVVSAVDQARSAGAENVTVAKAKANKR